MKKKIYNIFMVISFIPIIFLIYSCINSYINGFGSDPEVISSFLLPKEYGLLGIKMCLYYMFNPELLGVVYIPIYLACFIFQLIYFIKLKKR